MRIANFMAAQVQASSRVWLSSNTSVSIDVVVLCQARLVPGWVTTSAQNQAPNLSHCTVDRHNEYPMKAWKVNRHTVWYITSPYPWSCSVGWCVVDGQVTKISTDVREAVAHYIRGVFVTIHYTNPRLLYFTYKALSPFSVKPPNEKSWVPHWLHHPQPVESWVYPSPWRWRWRRRGRRR